MPRRVVGGLIQAATPLTDPATPIDKIRQAAIDVHLPLIDEAGKRGVQILGLQEIFNGPYFCPSQDKFWYDATEAIPGAGEVGDRSADVSPHSSAFPGTRSRAEGDSRSAASDV